MRKEITCYKKAIEIQPAQITPKMLNNHNKAVQILKNDPQLCTTVSFALCVFILSCILLNLTKIAFLSNQNCISITALDSHN